MSAPPFSAWEISLAARYLRAKRKEGGVALISIISFLGVMASVALLISTMAIMNGFRTDLLSRILGFNGHVFIGGPAIARPDREAMLARLRTIPGVAQVTPVTENQTLAIAGPSMQGVVVRGITPATLQQIRRIAGRDIFAPVDKAGRRLPAPDVGGFGRGDYGGDEILLGKPLADALGVAPGDRVELISPQGGATAFGSAPLRKTYTVGPTFSIGMAAYDQAYVFMPLEQAQLFFGKEGQWDTVEVKAKDPDKLDQLLPAIKTAAGSPATAIVTDWRDQNHALFNALQVEHVAMRLILLLIVAIAALNIISGLVMLVKNKSRDIAILRTMGAGPGAVLRIFFLAGSSIGAAGTLAGVVVAVLFCSFIGQIQAFLEWATHTKLFAADVYQLDRIPARIDWTEVGFIILFGLACSCLATLLPAWNASRIDPVEALRYE